MAFILNMARAAIEFALPPRCAGCGLCVGGDSQLCATCWQSLTFLTGPGCFLCGIPLAADHQICAPCLQVAPDHDGVRAAVSYGDVARTIVLKFKHGRRVGLAKMLASAVVRLIPDEAVLIVPVPLHRWRIWSRGFNQSALIAQALSQKTGHLVALDILRRVKSTPMLKGQGAQQRAATVRGAFSINPRQQGALVGQTIILIDDVYTSGATGNACARALKKAGAARVIIICWARVLKDNQLIN